MEKMERRNFPVAELRADAEARKIIGHAAVFNREADMGFFREMIEPGAFVDSIKEDDVRALFNHDPSVVLGRNRAGTLKLSEDERGLAVEIDPPDTQTARDLMTVINRGDVNQMSFAFITLNEEWRRGEEPPLRILKRVQLFDVSAVTFPAYPQTDVALRSLEAARKQDLGSPESLEPYYLQLDKFSAR